MTDPVVDSIAFFLVELVFPPFVRLARRSFGALSVGLFFSVRKVLGRSKANGLSALVTKMVRCLRSVNINNRLPCPIGNPYHRHLPQTVRAAFRMVLVPG